MFDLLFICFVPFILTPIPHCAREGDIARVMHSSGLNMPVNSLASGSLFVQFIVLQSSIFRPLDIP